MTERNRCVSRPGLEIHLISGSLPWQVVWAGLPVGRFFPFNMSRVTILSVFLPFLLTAPRCTGWGREAQLLAFLAVK